MALPACTTYADYAHRGVYPLLAAGFVLAVMAPNGTGERSAAIRGLVYVWLGHTLLLVGSAILRLDLYVAAYSPTLLRMAAFVWMGLTAIGLGLIAAQIALRRSDAWLIGANALALAASFYACTLVNVPALIADYNISHSRELTGEGSHFDVDYAMSLGPQAIPAIDRYLATAQGSTVEKSVFWWRDQAVARLDGRLGDWRAWTYRDRRLQRYVLEREAASDDRSFRPAAESEHAQ